MRKHKRVSAPRNAPRIATRTIRLVAKIPHAEINARLGIIASRLDRLDGGEAASVGGLFFDALVSGPFHGKGGPRDCPTADTSRYGSGPAVIEAHRAAA